MVASIIASALMSLGVVRHVDVYDLKVLVRVPRIYENSKSLGYRRWQRQYVIGEMWVDYDNSVDGIPRVTFRNCYNKTHLMSESPITYVCTSDDEYMQPRWAVMGNNRSGVFDKTSCCFYMDFEPSYNIGEDDPDNSLLLWFSGYGRLKRTDNRMFCPYWYGFCVGTMGCGCTAYGHKSPTRILGFHGPMCDDVTDVATIIGKWRARFNGTKTALARCCCN